MRTVRWIAWVALLCTGAASAQGRSPVLDQVEVPHSYYWRELFLPQLSSGPSSLAFTPDGGALVYSMAGSLWRQALDSDEAVQLTHADGSYDYQPDVASDGRRVLFVRYDGRGMALWLLDLADGSTRALTDGAAVDVEPRWSPDGRRVAWTSTREQGRFRVFTAAIGSDGLQDIRPILPERRSQRDRYYYSAFDHQINPAWSADGDTLFFVANPEVAWGSGDLYSLRLDRGEPRKLLEEETSWNLRPQPALDGRRVLITSYHGRQSEQLWLTTTDGAQPLPLTFGDGDRRQPRWSPDLQRIAYLDNSAGAPRIVLQELVGGATRELQAQRRRWLRPQGELALRIEDERGQPLPARVALLAADGRAYAPADAWLHADDGFDRERQRQETHYFHCPGSCRIAVPAGKVELQVQNGFAHRIAKAAVEVPAQGAAELAVALQALPLPPAFGVHTSADLHVHMNYGGTYRHTPASLLAQARAEDLDVVYNLIVNKEQRIPDIAHFRTDADPASDPQHTLFHGQEYHTSFWGHLGLLHLGERYLTPDFSSYRHTALASPYPHNGVIADLAHAQDALVGYVHPFDWPIRPAQEASLSHQLPADAILGKVDYLEVVAFSDHRATAEVWYRLLNLGLRLVAGAGTDAMANYASLRGPLGLNRVFLRDLPDRSPAALAAAIKQGRGFVSNGPLLGLQVEDRAPGETLQRADGQPLRYRIALRSPVPVQHLELVHNGEVVKRFALGEGGADAYDAEGELPIRRSGWLLLRAWSEHSDPDLLDLYPYASSNPVWLQLAEPAPAAPADAEYFVAWMDRVIAAAQARDDYNSAQERESTLDYLQRARARFLQLAGSGDAGDRR